MRCFLVEKDPEAYAKLTEAVAQFHKPEEGFEIVTFCGEFEDAIPAIDAFIGTSFPFIFIDPTGWTGFAVEKLKMLCQRPKIELLINFMYDFINRAAGMSDPATVASFDPILGPGWRERLDATLKRGLAVEKLFRETLAAACGLTHVVSTVVYRATKDRPHFYLVYGTKSPRGLEAFRDTEYDAAKFHARDRADAKERKEVEETRQTTFFTGLNADTQEAAVAESVEANKRAAAEMIVAELTKAGGRMRFDKLWPLILDAYALRVTNVKDICKQLAKDGVLEDTWGGGNNKPKDDTIIKLK